MKRFLVFAYDIYYPSGGLDDIIFQSDEFMDVIDPKPRWLEYDYIELLDMEKRVQYYFDSGIWKRV